MSFTYKYLRHTDKKTYLCAIKNKHGSSAYAITSTNTMTITPALFGKTILVGREQSVGRLCVGIVIDGQPYSALIGIPMGVPATVSRCIPKDGTAHCSIEVSDGGTMLLTNLKTQNITSVDGHAVTKKYITESSQIALGSDGYPMDLTSVIEAATQIVAKAEKSRPKSYSIAHLEKIWDDYETRNEKIEKNQRITNLLVRTPFIFSVLTGAFTGIAKYAGWENAGNVALILTIVGVVVFLYGNYKSFKSPAAKEKKENLKNLKSQYVCPNPDCRIKLTNFDYEELQKRKKCPHCGCRYEW